MWSQRNLGNTFLTGVSFVDFIWKIRTFLCVRMVKKGSCYSLQRYWGWEESLNCSHNPAVYQSYLSATKHSSLSPDSIFWRKTTLWAPLPSSSRCGMNSKHIWNLMQDFCWGFGKQPTSTPLWSAEVPRQLPLLVQPWLPNTCRSVVFLGASHQEASTYLISLLLVLFPIFQFCIAIDWLCAGWL